MNINKYRRVYNLLKENGHSPVFALEILMDAKRGNKRAMFWIRILHG